MEKEEEGVEAADQSAPADTEVSAADASAATEGEDYKALYEKAWAERENYRRALNEKRQLRNRKPDVEIEVEDELEEDKPLTRKDLELAIAPIVAQNGIKTVLGEMVKDPDKRKLVELYYETRIRQTGTSDEDIRRDIAAALDMADAERLRKVNAELMRKKDMTDTTPTTAGGSADRGADRKNHGYSDKQIEALTERARAIGADPAKFIENTWKNDPNRGR